MDFKADLKTATYKKEMEILDLKMELEGDLNFKKHLYR